MPFTAKTWQNQSAGGTPLSAAALIDLEQRLTGYADITDGTPWLPTGALAETIVRRQSTGAATTTSGTLRLAGGVVLPAGTTVSSITFLSVAAATSPTNQWFCLVRLSDRSVLAKTVDDTTAAWGANTAKTLAISGGYLASADTPVYLGIVQAAATPATLFGGGSSTGISYTLAPVLVGNSTAGLTDPASLGATAAAISGGSGNLIYAWCS